MSRLIRSFDIFDTLLVRRWCCPADLFVELGERLLRAGLVDIPPEDWGRYRQVAEVEVRKNALTEEVTLDEIYRRLAVTTGMGPAQVATALKMEVELEKESLEIVPETRELLRNFREQGDQIIFVSDMYLPVDVVVDMLNKYDLLRDDDKVYLSSDKMLTKSSGNLFSYIIENEGADPGQIFHTGDNYQSDIIVPKRLGINAELFSKARLNHIEEYISRQNHVPLRFRSLVAGASRLTRISFPSATHQENVIVEASSGIIAPVLFGFVFWCLTQARELGLKRLYFVSRDGQILLKIARTMIQSWGFDIECRYLYGSRHAWHLPAITELGEEEFEWIFAPTQFLSLRSVFNRVECNPEDFRDALEVGGFGEETWDRHLGRTERTRLRAFFEREEIRHRVLANSLRLKECLLGYLRQEGFGEGLPFGIVDVGWNGRLQRSLRKVLESTDLTGNNGFHGLYFGLKGRSSSVPSDHMHAYFADEGRGENLRLLLTYIPTLEQFFAADHGGVKGYSYDGDKFVPVLRSSHNTASLEWGLAVQQNAIVAYSKQLCEVLDPTGCSHNDFLTLSKKLLEFFLAAPGFDIASTFGRQHISEDQAEDRFYELAPRMSLLDALKYFYSGTLIHHNQWLEASMQRSDKICRFIISKSRYPVRKRVADIYKRICASIQ